MEPKKNPKYDIHRQRGVLLNIGLVVSFVIVITAFKWKVLSLPEGKYNFEEPIAIDPVFDDPRITTIKTNPPAKPKLVKPVVRLTPNIVESINPSSEDQPTTGLDQGEDPIQPGAISIEMPVENIEADTFRVVELMPTPVGGWAAFSKMLSSNIKYPRHAARIGATGKVFVEFTVNAKGELSHFKILKGIGHGCDEEARRVLSLTKWNPGKQRGKPVNVRMVQPISFSLAY